MIGIARKLLYASAAYISFSGLTVLSIAALMAGFIHMVSAAEIGLRGQVSAWGASNFSSQSQIGLRYIPELSYAFSLQERDWLDLEVSANLFGDMAFIKGESTTSNTRLKPYRMWGRYASDQYEIRLGLQKINFGTAMMLRPLMWFDSIDPRDPLQLTDGVYGVLGRYYFMNNSNIWLWMLYGNSGLRGWEVIKPDRHKPEFGGRLQTPMYNGEIAVSFHRRWIEINDIPGVSDGVIPEDRIGLDGKWDVGVGVWFEGVLVNKHISASPLKYQLSYNLGMDYTFAVGNGLNMVTEYFTMQSSEELFKGGARVALSAVSAGYPLGILDNIRAMIYYNWENRDVYRFVNWQRTYDNWQFYLMGFWNPEEYKIYQTTSGKNLYAGKGIQLMIVFNH